MKATMTLAALVVVLAGCQTGGGIHTVPTTRNYSRLPEANIRDAAAEVAQAEARTAQYDAPYLFFSAREYLQIAYGLRARGDRLGARDYAALAQRFAREANQSLPESVTAPTPPDANEEAVASAFDYLKADYLSLNRDAAIKVDPIYYARLTAQVSRAEHARQMGDWQAAASEIALARAALDRLQARDVDDDGIPDLVDEAPWAPEDMDGFEDEDGVPDLDNDRDGVLDTDDVKPDDPETINRYQDFDGAPDVHPELEEIQFSTGSAALSPEAAGYLKGVQLMLDCWPRLKLRIGGHASAGTGDRGSIDLSRRRAEAVRAFLLGRGVSDRQLVTTYHGDYKPVPGIAATDPRQARVTLQFE